MPAQPFEILRLAAALRNEVYRLVFAADKPILLVHFEHPCYNDQTFQPHTTLIRVNRQIRNETFTMYYKDVKFVIHASQGRGPHAETVRLCMRTLESEDRQLLAEVRVRIGDRYA